MKKPLKLFFNLLLNGDFVNSGYADKTKEEKISTYGDDITSDILAEVEIDRDQIDIKAEQSE